MFVDVGIDVGSVSINCVALDEEGVVIYEAPYIRHFGLVYEEVQKLLRQLLHGEALGSGRKIRSLSFTGISGLALAELFDAPYEVETIAQSMGAAHVAPGVRSIIAMGGQDATLLQLGHEKGRWHLESFNMNGPCASGTGSFIDQQAERLVFSMYGSDFHMDQNKLQQTLEDFIELGLQSTNPAPVACRCTVFTKSDMIHLQNKGETLSNIIAGLHHGNAANYMSTIVGNRKLDSPIIMIGGMASNQLQVQAFRHYFPQLNVPPHHTSLGALGVALQARIQGTRNTIDLSLLEKMLDRKGDGFPLADPLEIKHTSFDEDNLLAFPNLRPDAPLRAYLGVDIGSTSTKYALIGESGEILHKCYLPTRGKPIEVAQELLRTLKREWEGRLQLIALATTGSGRNVVGDFLDADLVIDEITAHARGAIAVDPEVDTIFEIGGQDSKYIRIDNTHPLDFDMNKVCAAGTGSFLHELANKMKINIVGEFQEVALSSRNPLHLAERCTVFMETDLEGYAQKGAKKEDLIAGLCYATVHNYLNRVVEKRRVGDRIMFLGGPSLNKGIVAAFEKILKKPLLVPKHREVLGGFGAALMVKELVENRKIIPKTHSFEHLADHTVSFSETICRADKRCHNECKLKVYSFGDRKSIWGGDCGRYEVTHHKGARSRNYFLERDQLFHEAMARKGIQVLQPDSPFPAGGTNPSLGIPFGLHSLEWGILWSHMFAGLGFDVFISPPTNSGIVRQGIECMTAETCFPVKVFHGHVRHLMDGVDYLFLPNTINMPTQKEEEAGYFCPLVESSQYMTKAALQIPEERLIRPNVFLKDGPEHLARALHSHLPRGEKRSFQDVMGAVSEAWKEHEAFKAKLLARGKQALSSLGPEEPLWVVTGRSYNIYDERLNLQMGRHFSKLGITALPMDFLDVEGEDLSDFPRMFWGSGTRILKTAKRIAREPNWFGVHITNFSCGADSFIEHFYRHILSEKPYLILELDEHSAVAGVLTRIEAFRNVVKNVQENSGNLPSINGLRETLACSM